MIIGLVGRAGSGKDTAARCFVGQHLISVNGEQFDVREALAAHREQPEPDPAASPESESESFAPFSPKGVQIALADPLKVFLLQVYQFSFEQLWGPSEKRNEGDRRYRRNYAEHEGYAPTYRFPLSRSTPITCARCGEDYSPVWARWGRGQVRWAGPCHDYLSPREALQTLGTDWGRRNFETTWVDLAIRNAKVLEKTNELVVISDVRHTNEMWAIAQAGGHLLHLEREGVGDVRSHESEHEMDSALVRSFLARQATRIENNGTIDELRRRLWLWYAGNM
jgi:hypothetical protein